MVNSGGVSSNPDPGPGVGLQNVRRRLEICYGSPARLDLSMHGQETLVVLSIPLAKPESASRVAPAI